MKNHLITFAWMEELLPNGYLSKPMFGGRGYYFAEKLILVVFASPGERSYKKMSFPFDLWNGAMFPVEKPHQAKVLKRFPFLTPHPVLQKWLYLPLDTEDFEELATQILLAIKKPQSTFGTIPAKKKKSLEPKAKSTEDLLEKSKNWTFSKQPTLFSDGQTPEEVLKKAKKFSDLKNLGPVTDKHFADAKIKSVGEFKKMGWEKAFRKLVAVSPKNRHAIYGYALIGALKNINLFQISEEDKKRARELSKELKVKKVK